ncbi:nitrite reductase NAD(P)H small subunit [Rhodococcoides trifolii]|uniref:Nitrite reductase NAD(P)H small subunit n=1 Tax=Rhodococcoides trifolii TaxID=908250 RepID=A0A917FVU7_9NOCA|nr:Rieske 2Fe-2S domain-containing protein [Rhodococcus trifolii]GGG10025.1 nitrite reductase NAD(P)H small subunit [Rhodococcus trifolii]
MSAAMDYDSSVVVGHVSDLTPGEGRTYVVGGRQIAVFLLGDGTVRAMDALCPHKGGPLADGQIDGKVVMCPLHQYQFSLADGGCTSEGIASVDVYEAAVVDGQVSVRL